MILYCVNCQKDIEGILTNGKEIYPHRPDLYNLKFYKCPVCGNYVGCHKGTEKPLGCIPSRELKRYRMSVHDILDPLWKSKKYKRKYIYNYISNKLGYEYHTGETKTKEECLKIIDILKELKDKDNVSI